MKLEVQVEKNFPGFGLRAEFTTATPRVGVFGRSGSGKSTLVHLLCGLERPDSGRIVIDGEILFCAGRRIDLPAEKRRIGVVFQQAHLFPHLSVKANLFYGFNRTPKVLRRIDPEALIRVLELDDLLGRGVETLSGGERQRVALGRAVLSSPRLLLMDEPLSALDEGLKYQIIPYLKAVFTGFEIPFLFISHSMNEMRLLTDEVVVVHKGEITAHTTPEELARERMGWTRSGYINLLRLADPRREEGLFVYPWGENRLLMWSGKEEGEAVFELSSKDIMLFKRHPEAVSARNLLHCRITDRFEFDGRVGVELDCGGRRLIAQVVERAAEELDLRIGGEIFAVIKASAFRRLY